MVRFSLAILFSCFLLSPVWANQVSGELREWHRVTVTFDGPSTSENANPNPFTDYRLNVTFTHQSNHSFTVPGYYAADGQAGESSATSGNKWRVHFAPPWMGDWTYEADFRQGENLAASTNPGQGQEISFDGASGSFHIQRTNKGGRDFRGKGRLDYVGEHHLRFAGSGEYFLKGGADSPENFLAYYEFDGTSVGNRPLKRYDNHFSDYEGGPTWKNGKGKRILGAVSYLAGKGVNSIYFLTMNVNGDGDDVWPWTSRTQTLRYDCSKLDQWEKVFTHMDREGVMLHVVTQETENDGLLDGGELGLHRKIYFRELVARFGHHLAMTWNLGEEWDRNPWQNDAVADMYHYLRNLLPQGNKAFITLHTIPSDRHEIYSDMIELRVLDGPSLQFSGDSGPIHGETIHWIQESAAAGKKWVVCKDESGGASNGCPPDWGNPSDGDYWHTAQRKDGLWGNLMAGGAGVEWYFGYRWEHDDLDCEDFRSRDHMWDLTRYGIEFFQEHLPFHEMSNANHLTNGANRCLAKTGESYAVYLRNGGHNATLDLEGSEATFTVQWYDPRYGGALQQGSVTEISGPGTKSLGSPPNSPDQDWAVLVSREGGEQNLPPSFVEATVSPNPFFQPGAVALTAQVQDPNGLEDIAGVYYFFFDPSARYFGQVKLEDQGNGFYYFQSNNVNGIQTGQWTYIPLVFDREGEFEVGGSLPFFVR